MQDGRKHGVPAFGAGGRTVDIALLCPAHVERRVAGANHAGDLHRYRFLADAGEWVIGAGVVVEHRRALVGGVVVGIEPVLPHHDGVDGQRANQRHEARQVVRDLRVAGPIRRSGLTYSAHLPGLIDLDDIGRHDGLRRAPHQAAGHQQREH